MPAQLHPPTHAHEPGLALHQAHRLTPFIMYVSVIFLITSSDSLMSYVVPIMINESVSSEATMGLIIAFSSMVGLACDFLFARFFRGKLFIFFLALTLLTALLFPLTLSFLPSIIPIFLLATGIWGIYYEALAYSNFLFVSHTVPLHKHESAWAKLNTVKSLTWTVGPLAASYLLLEGAEQVYQLVILLLCMAACVAVVSKNKWLGKRTHSPEPLSTHSSLVHQLKIWQVLLRTVWPLLLFYCMLFIIDSTFWTIGAVMAESMKATSVWGGLMLSAYMLPGLLFSGLAIPAAKPFGKKRMAFLLGIASGLCLSLMGLTTNPAVIVGIVFVSACLSAVIWPEMAATFENYIARLKDNGVDMIGLQASVGSLSYIIGPIVAGFGAALLGNRMTFSVLGLLFAFISVVLLLIVPRKIKMPQQQLEEVTH